MMAFVHSFFDSMQPTGIRPFGASVTTRMRSRTRGVERNSYALERTYQVDVDIRAIGQNVEDSKQYQPVERPGADIVKRGRTQ